MNTMSSLIQPRSLVEAFAQGNSEVATLLRKNNLLHEANVFGQYQAIGVAYDTNDRLNDVQSAVDYSTRATSQGLACLLSAVRDTNSSLIDLSDEIGQLRRSSESSEAMFKELLGRDSLQARMEEFIYQLEKMVSSYSDHDDAAIVQYWAFTGTVGVIEQDDISTVVIRGRDNKAAFERAHEAAKRIHEGLTGHHRVREMFARLAEARRRQEEEERRREEEQRRAEQERRKEEQRKEEERRRKEEERREEDQRRWEEDRPRREAEHKRREAEHERREEEEREAQRRWNEEHSPDSLRRSIAAGRATVQSYEQERSKLSAEEARVVALGQPDVPPLYQTKTVKTVGALGFPLWCSIFLYLLVSDFNRPQLHEAWFWSILWLFGGVIPLLGFLWWCMQCDRHGFIAGLVRLRKAGDDVKVSRAEALKGKIEQLDTKVKTEKESLRQQKKELEVVTKKDTPKA
jgi:hypothetical protein